MVYKGFKDIKLSRLGMGNMRLPKTSDDFRAPVDYPKAKEIIDFAMANGINYYDTAYVYHGGDSEKFLGETLPNYPRESYYLATKYIIHSSPDYKAVFEEQLQRLKTDYIDFYLLHAVMDNTYQQYIDSGCIAYFEEQKAKGRIKYFGFSNHSKTENLKKFLELRDWDFCQMQLNYYDWVYGSTKEQYEILSQKGIPIMAMTPVRGGRLSGLSPASEKVLKDAKADRSIVSWAFYWLKRLSGVQVILSGMSTLDQIKENVPFFASDEALSDTEEKTLFEACDVFRKEVQVPCNACRYCFEGCPAKIDIVKYLEVYNKYKTDGDFALGGINNIESEGKHTDCIACGVCNERCPQSIDIKSIMAELIEKTKK